MLKHLLLIPFLILLVFAAPSKQLLKLPVSVSKYKYEKFTIAASIARLNQRYGKPSQLFNQPLANYDSGNFYYEGMIGTTGLYKLIMDSGNINFWVFDASCSNNGRSCPAQNKYNYTSSVKGLKCNETVSFYNNGYSIVGNVYTDSFCFDTNSNNYACTDQYQSFAGALSDPGRNGFDYDGVLGLNYNSISGSMPQPMKQIFDKSTCAHKLFALWMDRSQNNAYKGGELHICDTDSTRFNVRFTDNINKSAQGPITYAQVNSWSNWRIPIDSVAVNQKHVADLVDAIVDTGTHYIFGPPDQVAQLQKLIGATPIGGGEYEVDCGKISLLPDIAVKISGTDFVLKGADYTVQMIENGNLICFSGIVGSDIPAPAGPAWVFGNLIVGRFYTIFDFENGRLGFANPTYTSF